MRYIKPMPGRPRKPYLRQELKLSLPASLVAEVDLMLEDPLTRRPKYAARARLVEALLKNWLAAQKGEPTNKLPSLIELREGALA